MAALNDAFNASPSNLFFLFQFIQISSESDSLNASSPLVVAKLLESSSPAGFACAFNIANDYGFGDDTFEGENGPLRTTSGNLALVCVSPDVIASAAFDDSMFKPNPSISGNIVGAYAGKKMRCRIIQDPPS